MEKNGKKALITGITGQDGAYLAEFLMNKGYAVFGTYRRVSTPNFWRLQSLNIIDKVKLIPTDIADSSSIIEAINLSAPDEIYHLAAQSFVGASFEQPEHTANITGLGTTRILEGIRHVNKKIKFYQASSSELYGCNKNDNKPQNEKTPFDPASPYGAAKHYAYDITGIYKESYGIFACNGILFNHESPLRGLEFVTRKISNSVAKIKLGLEKEISLGNLEAKRDWGYAPDFVEAMWLMLQKDKAENYVIATGESHSVKEFLERAFSLAGLNWKKYTKTEKRFFRPLEVTYLCGDFSKAEKEIGWKPKVKFNELVEIMVNEDLNRWERWQRGEVFSWDAPSYTEKAKIITRAIKM